MALHNQQLSRRPAFRLELDHFYGTAGCFCFYVKALAGNYLASERSSKVQYLTNNQQLAKVRADFISRNAGSVQIMASTCDMHAPAGF
jgi:hypothetical protein